MDESSQDNSVAHCVVCLSASGEVPRHLKGVYPTLDPILDSPAQVANEHGILLDPVWTLAAWEVAQQLSQQTGDQGQVPVMLHTGGSALALQGLSQRFPDLF